MLNSNDGTEHKPEMEVADVAAYKRAVQNPSRAFSDRDLLSGTVVKRNGTPHARSGKFAVVFRLDDAKGRSWALRAPKVIIPDHEKRYQAIEEFWQSHRYLKWLVETRYLSNGIFADDKWCPAIKMAWADARELLAFVELNVHNPGKLRSLAAEIVEMFDEMEREGVSHGDIQHGNILVRNGKPILVDYDGLFISGLERIGRADDGHESYQHPGDAPPPWSSNCHRFPGWVVVASLLTIACDPSYFDEDEEDRLVWGREDLRGETTALAQLGNEVNPKLSNIGRNLLTLSALDVNYITAVSLNIETAWPSPGHARAASAGASAGRRRSTVDYSAIYSALRSFGGRAPRKRRSPPPPTGSASRPPLSTDPAPGSRSTVASKPSLCARLRSVLEGVAKMAMGLCRSVGEASASMPLLRRLKRQQKVRRAINGKPALNRKTTKRINAFARVFELSPELKKRISPHVSAPLLVALPLLGEVSLLGFLRLAEWLDLLLEFLQHAVLLWTPFEVSKRVALDQRNTRFRTCTAIVYVPVLVWVGLGLGSLWCLSWLPWLA